MAGFNGSTLTPINSNNKSEVRNTLDVYSKSEIDNTISQITAAPYVATITTGQWSGSDSDYYITVTASNVTADSILVPTYDHTSDSQLNGPVWCVPAAGSFAIHTSAIPSGTVTIMVQFIGTLGEAQYQVLADVYSKSQTDTLVAESTAIKYEDIIIPSITISSGGYGDIRSYKPFGMTNFLFALLWNYHTNDANGCVNVLASGDYLIASANATITNAKVRYYYKD